MKLAFYILTGIVLAGLGVGLPFSAAEKMAVSRQPIPVQAERVVYVDTAQLVEAHPAWEALYEMRATSARAGGTARVNPASNARAVGVKEVRADETAQSVTSRHEPTAAAARSAVEALRGLEQEKREALWMRLASKKTAMMNQAESDIAVEARKIETDAAAMAKSIEQQYCPDRLNARLKVFAMKVAAKADTIDATNVSDKLAGVESALGRLDDACTGEQERIKSAARAKISALHDAALADVENKINAEEIREVKRIEDSVARMRDDLLKGMLSGEMAEPDVRVAAGALDAKPNVLALPAHRVARGANQDMAALESAANALEIRIRRDVARAVKELAEEKNLKVVFHRDGDRVEDGTQMFARLLRNHLARTVGPVLSEVRGS